MLKPLMRIDQCIDDRQWFTVLIGRVLLLIAVIAYPLVVGTVISQFRGAGERSHDQATPEEKEIELLPHAMERLKPKDDTTEALAAITATVAAVSESSIYLRCGFWCASGFAVAISPSFFSNRS